MPEYRGRGVDVLLYHWIWTHAAARGMPWGEASWLLEDNTLITGAATKLGFHNYKTYRIYDKPL